jgi:hypothetical protein
MNTDIETHTQKNMVCLEDLEQVRPSGDATAEEEGRTGTEIHTLIISALGRPRQEDCKFEVSLGYRARLWLKKNVQRQHEGDTRKMNSCE